MLLDILPVSAMHDAGLCPTANIQGHVMTVWMTSMHTELTAPALMPLSGSYTLMKGEHQDIFQISQSAWPRSLCGCTCIMMITPPRLLCLSSSHPPCVFIQATPI